MSSVNPTHSKFLTKTESISVANKLIQALLVWDGKKVTKGKAQKLQNNFLKPLVVRVLGSVALVFAALADVFMHLGIGVVKGAVVLATLPVRPFKCVKLPRELRPSSPFVHLVNSLRSIVYVATIPLVMLFDPESAYRLTLISSQKDEKALEKQIANLQSNEITLEPSLDDLQLRINDLKQKKVALSTSHDEAQGALSYNAKSYKKEISNLKSQIKDLKAQLSSIPSSSNVNSDESVLKDSKISALEESIERLNLQVAKNYQDKGILDLGLRYITKDNSELKTKISSLEGEIKALQEKYDAQKKELDDLKIQYELKQTTLAKTKKESAVLESKVDELVKQSTSNIALQQASSSSSVSSLNSSSEILSSAQPLLPAPLPPPLTLSDSQTYSLLDQSYMAPVLHLPPPPYETMDKKLEASMNEISEAEFSVQLRDANQALLEQLHSFKKLKKDDSSDVGLELDSKINKVVDKFKMVKDNHKAFAKLRNTIKEIHEYLVDLLNGDVGIDQAESALGESTISSTLLASTMSHIKSDDKDAISFRISMFTAILKEIGSQAEIVKQYNQEKARNEAEERAAASQKAQQLESERKARVKNEQLESLTIKPAYEDVQADIHDELKNAANWGNVLLKLREYDKGELLKKDISFDEFKSEIDKLIQEINTTPADDFKISDKHTIIKNVIEFINARRYLPKGKK